MKKISLSLFTALAFTTTGFASPLTDYSSGKMSIDISLQSSSISESYHDTDGSTLSNPKANGKNIASFGITAGLGNHLAIEYKNSSPKTKNTDYFGLTEFNTKLQTNELNVHYQVNQFTSFFTGLTQVKAKQWFAGTTWIDSSTSNTDRKNIWQIGVSTSAPISSSSNVFAAAAVGKDLTAYKIGISYLLDKNWEFNTYYGYNKYKGLKWDDGYSNDRSDFTAAGMGYGVTYKF